jgi:hypothetical protein
MTSLADSTESTASNAASEESRAAIRPLALVHREYDPWVGSPTAVRSGPSRGPDVREVEVVFRKRLSDAPRVIPAFPTKTSLVVRCTKCSSDGAVERWSENKQMHICYACNFVFRSPYGRDYLPPLTCSATLACSYVEPERHFRQWGLACPVCHRFYSYNTQTRRLTQIKFKKR